MRNPFAPNKNGVVVVTLAQPYGSNVAGEKAGFLPEIAKALVKKGMAVLPGQAPVAPQADAGAQDGAEMTSRKFQPARDPLDHDGDGKKGGSLPVSEPSDAIAKLRADFKELTGKDAHARWGEARLKAEVDKALEAATAPADGQAEAPQADAGA